MRKLLCITLLSTMRRASRNREKNETMRRRSSSISVRRQAQKGTKRESMAGRGVLAKYRLLYGSPNALHVVMIIERLEKLAHVGALSVIEFRKGLGDIANFTR